MKRTAFDQAYKRQKEYAQDRLGGARAYFIQAPSIRRMAVADAILSSLALQDEENVSDQAVRKMLAELFDRLTSDEEFQG